MLNTVLRTGELLGLLNSDIDLENKTFSFGIKDGSITNGNGDIIYLIGDNEIERDDVLGTVYKTVPLMGDIVTIIYDHHYTGVMENLAEIQHSFRNEINTSMHIHMTDKYCMEIVVVNGDIAEIRDLTERIMRLKGVEHVKLTSTANGEDFNEPGHSHDHGHHHH